MLPGSFNEGVHNNSWESNQDLFQESFTNNFYSNNLFNEQNINSEERYCAENHSDSIDGNNLNRNRYNSTLHNLKLSDEKIDENFFSEDSGIYRSKIDDGMDSIDEKNKENIQDININQENIDINIDNEEEKEEKKEEGEAKEEKEKEEKQKENKGKKKKKRNKDKEYSKLILRLRTAITKNWIVPVNRKIKNICKKLKIKVKTLTKPDYELFNEKSKQQKVREEFNMKMKDIFNLHRKTKKKPNKNPEIIKTIETIYYETPSEDIKEIYDLIHMTYKEVVELFFDNPDSKALRKLKKKEKNIIVNQNYIEEYGDSLLEKDGFFRYFENKEKNSRKKKKKINMNYID